MLNKLIEWCLRNKFLVFSFFILITSLGFISMQRIPVDAIPDIGELQVIVYTEWMGRSPKDIEDQVIYPATTRLLGVPRVKVIRSLSGFGMGLIYIIFKDGTDYYWARTRVLERLPLAQQAVPEDVMFTLGPDTTALGQVFWYTVENGYYCPEHPDKAYEKPGKCPINGKELVLSKYNLGELRSIQDWYVRLQLNTVYGVSEVASVGGFVKEYQVDVDPNKLLSYKISLHEVMEAVKRSNIDVGAKVFEEASAGIEFLIRGVGFIKKIEDIEDIVVGAYNGTPVYIKNIANVTLGGEFRIGALDKEGKEAVGAVVLMRYGENPLSVIHGIKEKIKEIEPGLPSGVRIIDFYDRTQLIHRTIDTLKDALIKEIITVIFVIGVFLLHFWASFVISLVLPLAILLAFLFMYYTGIDVNVMTLGGIAIAIGIMDDVGGVLVENIYRHLAEKQAQKAGRLSPMERLETCIRAAQEVGPSLLTALSTTIVGFFPVFALTGEAGRLFRPLAFSQTYSLIAASIISLCLMPSLAYYLLRGKLKIADKNFTTRNLLKIYEPALRFALKHRVVTILFALLIIVAGVISAPRVKQEFMPPLNEGDLLYMPVLLPGASLTQVMEVMKKQDMIIKNEFPNEVELVVGKLGKATSATDPAPVIMLETTIRLKPEKYWRKRMTREKLIAEIIEKTKMPGVAPIMTQPIRNRIDMLATGIQTPVGIKVLGPDLKTIEELAIQLEQIVTKEVKGTTNAFAERFGNRPYFEIEIDRREIARYGVKISDVQDIIMSAIGGISLTTTVEGRERYPVRVRYLRELRDNPEALKRIFVPTASGEQVPLVQIAKLIKRPGPQMIATENTLPYARVFINVNPKIIGLVDYVNLAKEVVAQKIKSGELKLPQGYFIQWSGQYEAEMEARKRLLLVVPVSLLVIMILLYINFKSFISLGITATGLPISLMAGVIYLYLFGYNFSTAVWVGFILLFGVATDNAVVLVAYFDLLLKERKIASRQELREAIVEGALTRVRASTMSTVTTIIALVPLMLATGAGSEIMKPMATPLFGGLTVVTLTNFLFVPALYFLVKEKQLRLQK
jgi:Cu(I)/Ag(I) efflux system membrane protein CusA/SilA